jgi:hypothetical protein
MTQRIKDIRPLNRFVTTHNSDGKAVFSPRLIENMPAQTGNGFTFSLAYTSMKFPCELSNESDIASYENHLLSPPGLTISSGTVCRIVDFPPAAESPMHRTISLEYGVVLEGEIGLILDSSENRVMKRGDVAVQRATNHAWKNITPKEGWARMLYVLTTAKLIEIQGAGFLGEVIDGIDVRPSQ